jgi:hypothetical protein
LPLFETVGSNASTAFSSSSSTSSGGGASILTSSLCPHRRRRQRQEEEHGYGMQEDGRGIQLTATAAATAAVGGQHPPLPSSPPLPLPTCPSPLSLPRVGLVHLSVNGIPLSAQTSDFHRYWASAATEFKHELRVNPSNGGGGSGGCGGSNKGERGGPAFATM